MADLPITVACGPYDRMEALRGGAIQVEGIDVTYVAIQSPPEIFARMVKTDAFDVSEMSTSHYFTMRAAKRSEGDWPFIALPVFPSRVFRHGFVFVNTRSGIRSPKDLEGKRIGVQEYRQTAAVWIRGILQAEYGVDFTGVTWLEGGVDTGRRPDDEMDLRPNRPLNIEHIGDTRSLNELLEAGEIDAYFGARRPASFGRNLEIARLFPNYREVEREYFRSTGIFPIMHTLVMKESLYREKPWVAESLFKGFQASKQWAAEQMRFSGAMRYMLPWLFDDLDEVDELFGGDPFPYGVEPNRPTLEMLMGFLVDQGFVESPPPVDELFTPIVGWEE